MAETINTYLLRRLNSYMLRRSKMLYFMQTFKSNTPNMERACTIFANLQHRINDYYKLLEKQGIKF